MWIQEGEKARRQGWERKHTHYGYRSAFWCMVGGIQPEMSIIKSTTSPLKTLGNQGSLVQMVTRSGKTNIPGI